MQQWKFINEEYELKKKSVYPNTWREWFNSRESCIRFHGEWVRFHPCVENVEGSYSVLVSEFGSNSVFKVLKAGIQFQGEWIRFQLYV